MQVSLHYVWGLELHLFITYLLRYELFFTGLNMADCSCYVYIMFRVVISYFLEQADEDHDSGTESDEEIDHTGLPPAGRHHIF